MKNQLLPAFFAVIAFVGILTGCVQKEDYKEPEINPDDPALVSYEYSILIPAANEVQAVLLRDFTQPVYKIDNPASWVTVEVSDQTQDGFQVLNVIGTQANTDQEATITIKSQAREEIKLLVLQGKMADADNGGNDEFYTDWENYTTIRINGRSNPVALPWITGSENNIPYDITKQYKKEHGWEMAFCSLSNTATENIRYFALYNKFSGTLRVFHFMLDPTEYGQEINYKVWMGRQLSGNNAPYYHSLEFGVPTNHKFADGTLSPNANFIGQGADQSQSFLTWVTPYLRVTEMLTPGWYCFDLDMTGYIPQGTQWREFDDDLKMSIVPVTRNVENITLRGSLAGDINGTFDNPQTVVQGTGNCLSGICSTLNMMNGMCSSSLGSAAQYTGVLQGSAVNGIAGKMGKGCFWGGLALGAAVPILNLIGDALVDTEPEYTYIPGKIDMKLDAQLDLVGTITNYKSSKEAIFNVTLDNVNTANGAEGQFGRGIWSLAEDPVVYVDGEDLMADYDHFTIYNKSNNQYYSSDFNQYGVRFVYFLDPTSIKLNINTDFFDDIQNVVINTSCGVYPSRQAGYATAYRSFMGLDSPQVQLTNGTKEVVRLSNTSTPRILNVKPQELLLSGEDEYETPANSKKVQQKGGVNYYYGYVVHDANKDIVVDPQIYMNITTPNGHINNPTLPSELLVSVEIVFESHGNTYLFSKCFVPRVVVIDRATTLQKYNQLKQFSKDCEDRKPVTTLANKPSVPVTHPNGALLIAKTLRMLKRVEEGK